MTFFPLNDFMRYLAVGAATALLYFGLIFLLVEFFGLEGIWPISAAYILAVSFHFLCNKFYTFRRSGTKSLREIFRYFGLLFVNYTITIVVVHVTVNRLGYPTYVGAALAIAATLAIGYAMTKLWVFQRTRG